MPRKICKGCQRPISVCLCEHLVQMTLPTRLMILQHPSEQKHPLATVPILKACLPELELHVGERFSLDEFASVDLSRCRVLFPSEGAEIWNIESSRVDGDNQLDGLFILDGTWRKAKRMWFENPWLQEIPAVTLRSESASNYRIRSSRIEGGLSTLESVVLAGNYLQGSKEYDALLKPFEAMIDMQIKKMGIETFNAHYKGQSDQD